MVSHLHRQCTFVKSTLNKWLKSGRLPLSGDIVLFVFNDGNCAKESICWKLGKVVDVTGTKVTMLSNTVD